ncbi:CNH-domain-containing protein [Mucor ambiguus]|uniref:CNH-domain-containing protein n=1 Tax=Mucor ambiguus TaxID=91626 RepID=A0A0C9MTU7_9FUNG|nr:CNH-domain-containing protein [Mucor ambiguus]
MSLPPQTITAPKDLNEKKPRLLQRNSSQLLQHATSKFGLRRSLTTASRAQQQSQQQSPQQHIKPRPSTSSVSFSTHTNFLTNANTKRYHHHVQNNVPQPNANSFTSDSVTSQILSSYNSTTTTTTTTAPPLTFTNNSKMTALHQDNANNRLLSAIPENKQQGAFRMYSSNTATTATPGYYRAFLSSIAFELKRRIITNDRIKNDIELIDDIIEIYQFNQVLFHGNNRSSSTTSTTSSNSSSGDNSFSVTSTIIGNYASEDEAENDDDHDSLHTDTTAATSTHSRSHSQQQQQQQQGQRQQPDSHHLLLPNGIYTELTHCYTPTCNNMHPCYSYTCPKRERLRKRPHSVDTREKRVTAYIYEVEKHQQLWSQTIDDYIVLSTPATERKRQETIFELIYTEENFLNDLDYVIKMWMEPLKNSDIIPLQRREQFLDKVFSNLIDIRNISTALTLALRARQSQHPIVSQISDIMERFTTEFEPFVYYGARQHQAKHVYEHERYNNPKFALFAEKTERDAASRKLELNGYLTKPTTRLGRYTLLLDKIHARTSPSHPDKENIPRIIHAIKQLLQRVNNAAGAAKTRFDLEQIHRHLTFKNKRDAMDLRLLDQGRSIIKQGTLRKTASMDSTEYQVILFDHYLVTAKVKVVNAVEHYCVQKRPIPIELLGVILPPLSDSCTLQRKKSSSTLLFSSLPISPAPSNTSNNNNKIAPSSTHNQILDSGPKQGAPITLFHQGRNVDSTYTLYAPTEHNRKTWNEIIQTQRDIKFKRKPIFDLVDSVKRYEFFAEIRAHHMAIFDQGQSYLLSTDGGLYIGPNNGTGIPRKILPLEKVYQVHVLEDYQLLLVLADHTLWQYPLDITINGRPDGNQSIQHFGRKIRSNVSFFHVGECLGQTLICVPKPTSVNGTEIDLYEPSMPKTELKKKSLLGRLSIRSTSSLSLMNTQVTHLKPIYSPCDVWAIDNTRSMLLLTTPVGIVAVDMKTKKADGLLDPSDKYLEFITRYERIDEQIKMNPVIKRIAVFAVPSGDYLVCYDRFAFYIDKKGRRTQHKFKIEWEGHPTAFAFHYPHVIAFEQQFIEIRSVIDGHLQQVIQEKNVDCLQNGHKSKEALILGTMVDNSNPLYQQIFQLQPISHNEN